MSFLSITPRNWYNLTNILSEHHIDSNVINILGEEVSYQVMPINEALERCHRISRQQQQHQQEATRNPSSAATSTSPQHDPDSAFRKKQLEKEAEMRKQQRKEDAKRRRQLKRQIRADKEERKRRLRKESPQDSSADHASNTTTTTTTTQTSLQTPPSGSCLIQIRLPNGEILKHSFQLTDHIQAIVEYIAQNLSDTQKAAFSLMTPFPRQIIGEEQWVRPIHQVLGNATRVSLVMQYDSQRGEVAKGSTFVPVTPAPTDATTTTDAGTTEPNSPTTVEARDDELSAADDTLHMEESGEYTNWERLLIRDWRISAADMEPLKKKKKTTDNNTVVSETYIIYRPVGHAKLEQESELRPPSWMPSRLQFIDEHHVNVTNHEGSQSTMLRAEIQRAIQQLRETVTRCPTISIDKDSYIIHVLTSEILILRPTGKH